MKLFALLFNLIISLFALPHWDSTPNERPVSFTVKEGNALYVNVADWDDDCTIGILYRDTDPSDFVNPIAVSEIDECTLQPFCVNIEPIVDHLEEPNEFGTISLFYLGARVDSFDFMLADFKLGYIELLPPVNISFPAGVSLVFRRYGGSEGQVQANISLLYRTATLADLSLGSSTVTIQFNDTISGLVGVLVDVSSHAIVSSLDKVVEVQVVSSAWINSNATLNPLRILATPTAGEKGVTKYPAVLKRDQSGAVFVPQIRTYFSIFGTEASTASSAGIMSSQDGTVWTSRELELGGLTGLRNVKSVADPDGVHIYILGTTGAFSGGALLRYNVLTNEVIQTVIEAPHALRAGLALFGSRLYIIAGGMPSTRSITETSDLGATTFDSLTFSTFPDMEFGERRGVCAIVLHDRFFVFGGQNNEFVPKALNEVWFSAVGSPAVWHQGVDLDRTWNDFSCVSDPAVNIVYLVGGSHSTPPLAQSLKVNADGTVVKIQDFAGPSGMTLEMPLVFLVDGVVFLVGGSDVPTYLDDAYWLGQDQTVQLESPQTEYFVAAGDSPLGISFERVGGRAGWCSVTLAARLEEAGGAESVEGILSLGVNPIVFDDGAVAVMQSVLHVGTGQWDWASIVLEFSASGACTWNGTDRVWLRVRPGDVAVHGSGQWDLAAGLSVVGMVSDRYGGVALAGTFKDTTSFMSLPLAAGGGAVNVFLGRIVDASPVWAISITSSSATDAALVSGIANDGWRRVAVVATIRGVCNIPSVGSFGTLSTTQAFVFMFDSLDGSFIDSWTISDDGISAIPVALLQLPTLLPTHPDRSVTTGGTFLVGLNLIGGAVCGYLPSFSFEGEKQIVILSVTDTCLPVLGLPGTFGGGPSFGSMAYLNETHIVASFTTDKELTCFSNLVPRGAAFLLLLDARIPHLDLDLHSLGAIVLGCGENTTPVCHLSEPLHGLVVHPARLGLPLQVVYGATLVETEECAGDCWVDMSFPEGTTSRSQMAATSGTASVAVVAFFSLAESGELIAPPFLLVPNSNAKSEVLQVGKHDAVGTWIVFSMLSKLTLFSETFEIPSLRECVDEPGFVAVQVGLGAVSSILNAFLLDPRGSPAGYCPNVVCVATDIAGGFFTAIDGDTVLVKYGDMPYTSEDHLTVVVAGPAPGLGGLGGRSAFDARSTQLYARESDPSPLDCTWTHTGSSALHRERVRFSVSNASARGEAATVAPPPSASLDLDFVYPPQEVQWFYEEDAMSISVTLLDDFIPETEEEFSVAMDLLEPSFSLLPEPFKDVFILESDAEGRAIASQNVSAFCSGETFTGGAVNGKSVFLVFDLLHTDDVFNTSGTQHVGPNKRLTLKFDYDLTLTSAPATELSFQGGAVIASPFLAGYSSDQLQDSSGVFTLDYWEESYSDPACFTPVPLGPGKQLLLRTLVPRSCLDISSTNGFFSPEPRVYAVASKPSVFGGVDEVVAAYIRDASEPSVNVFFNHLSASGGSLLHLIVQWNGLAVELSSPSTSPTCPFDPLGIALEVMGFSPSDVIVHHVVLGRDTCVSEFYGVEIGKGYMVEFATQGPTLLWSAAVSDCPHGECPVSPVQLLMVSLDAPGVDLFPERNITKEVSFDLWRVSSAGVAFDGAVVLGSNDSLLVTAREMGTVAMRWFVLGTGLVPNGLAMASARRSELVVVSQVHFLGGCLASACSDAVVSPAAVYLYAQLAVENGAVTAARRLVGAASAEFLGLSESGQLFLLLGGIDNSTNPPLLQNINGTALPSSPLSRPLGAALCPMALLRLDTMPTSGAARFLLEGPLIAEEIDGMNLTVTVSIQRVGQPDVPLSLRVVPVFGTASPADIFVESDALIWERGSTLTKSFSFEVVDNSEWQPENRSFHLEMRDLSGQRLWPSRRDTAVNVVIMGDAIQDCEVLLPLFLLMPAAVTPGCLQWALAASTHHFPEAFINFSLAVSRIGGVDGGLLQPSMIFSGGGLAAVDEISVSGPGKFSNGVSQRFVNISLYDDLAYEGEECVTLELIGAAVCLGSSQLAVCVDGPNDYIGAVQLVDPPWASLEELSMDIMEGREVFLSFEWKDHVKYSGVVTLTANVHSSNITAVSVYPTSLSWSAEMETPQELRISVNGDSVWNGAQEREVLVFLNSSATNNFPSCIRVSVIDDDPKMAGNISWVDLSRIRVVEGSDEDAVLKRTAGTDGDIDCDVFLTDYIESPSFVQVETDPAVAEVHWGHGDSMNKFVTLASPYRPGVQSMQAMVLRFSCSAGTAEGSTSRPVFAVDADAGAGLASFVSARVYLNENKAQNATVLIQRVASDLGVLTCTVFAAGGGAVPGVDYVFPNTTMEWTDSDSSIKEVTVSLLAPADTYEPAMNVSLRLSGCAAGSFPVHTILIPSVNIGEEGCVDFSDPRLVLPEGSTAVMHIYRGSGSSGPLEVDVVADPSQTTCLESDFSFDLAVFFPHGATASAISFRALTDATVDPECIVVLLLSTLEICPGGDMDVPGSAQVRITDVPANPGAVAVAKSSRSLVVSDTWSHTVSIVLQRSGGCDGGAVVEVTASGTAGVESDYLLINDTVIWSNGVCGDKAVLVEILYSGLTEAVNETLVLNVSALSPPNLLTFVDNNTASILILNDNRPGSVAFNSSETLLGVEGELLNFTLIVRDGTGGGFVDVLTPHESLRVVIPPGKRLFPVSMRIHDDFVFEDRSIFSMWLSSPSGGLKIGFPPNVTVDLAPSDPPVFLAVLSPVESNASCAVPVLEGSIVRMGLIRISGARAGAVAVEVSEIGSTLIFSPIVIGLSASDEVSMTSFAFTIPKDDAVAAKSSTLLVSLVNPSGDLSLPSGAPVATPWGFGCPNITIHVLDKESPGELSWQSSFVVAVEGALPVNISAVRSGYANGSVVVTPKLMMMKEGALVPVPNETVASIFPSVRVVPALDFDPIVFSVVVHDDDLSEVEETYLVQLAVDPSLGVSPVLIGSLVVTVTVPSSDLGVISIDEGKFEYTTKMYLSNEHPGGVYNTTVVEVFGGASLSVPLNRTKCDLPAQCTLSTGDSAVFPAGECTAQVSIPGTVFLSPYDAVSTLSISGAVNASGDCSSISVWGRMSVPSSLPAIYFASSPVYCVAGSKRGFYLSISRPTYAFKKTPYPASVLTRVNAGNATFGVDFDADKWKLVDWGVGFTSAKFSLNLKNVRQEEMLTPYSRYFTVSLHQPENYCRLEQLSNVVWINYNPGRLSLSPISPLGLPTAILSPTDNATWTVQDGLNLTISLCRSNGSNSQLEVWQRMHYNASTLDNDGNWAGAAVFGDKEEGCFNVSLALDWPKASLSGVSEWRVHSSAGLDAAFLEFRVNITRRVARPRIELHLQSSTGSALPAVPAHNGRVRYSVKEGGLYSLLASLAPDPVGGIGVLPIALALEVLGTETAMIESLCDALSESDSFSSGLELERDPIEFPLRFCVHIKDDFQVEDVLQEAINVTFASNAIVDNSTIPLMLDIDGDEENHPPTGMLLALSSPVNDRISSGCFGTVVTEDVDSWDFHTVTVLTFDSPVHVVNRKGGVLKPEVCLDRRLDAGEVVVWMETCDSREECFTGAVRFSVALTAPSIPDRVETESCGEAIVVSWRCLRSPRAATSFVVLLEGDAGNSLVTTNKTGVNYAPQGVEVHLTAGKSYNISVRSVNALGESAWSARTTISVGEGGCTFLKILTDTNVPVFALGSSIRLVPGATEIISIALPTEPSVTETVGIECAGNNSVQLRASPAKLTFGVMNWQTLQKLELGALDDEINSNSPSVPVQVSCEVKSSSSTGYFKGVPLIVFDVEVMNVILPVVADIQLETDMGKFQSSITVNADGESEFSLTLSGSFVLALIANSTRSDPSFVPNMTVLIGGAPSTILKVESTGMKALLTSPTYADVCGVNASSDAEDCGYKTVKVLNHDPPDGSVGGSWELPSAMDIYYSKVCVGYTTGKQCLLSTVSHKCAFGAGDSCIPCPVGAICPGGFRAWPLVGYWNKAENASDVFRCQPPSTKRCLGWNKGTRKAMCGVGYGSVACSSCETGFFLTSIGEECVECGHSSATGQILIPLATILFGALAIGLLTFWMVWRVTKHSGGTLRGGFNRTKDFTIYVIVLMQTVVAVGQDSTAALPQYMQGFYGFLSLFQLDLGSQVHPDCLTSNPFIWEMIKQGVGLFLLLAALGIGSVKNRGKRLQKLLSRVFTSLTCFYPLIVRSGLLTTHCMDSGDGRSVLVMNPRFECWTGEHTLPGILGLTSLLLVSVLFPIATYCLAKKRVALFEAEGEHGGFEHYLAGTFKAKRFYIRHLNFAVLFILAAGSMYIRTATFTAQAGKCFFFSVLLLAQFIAIASLQPYRRVKLWMLPVRLWSLLVALLGVILNYLSYLADEDDSYESSVSQLTVILFISSVLLFVIMAIAFYSVLDTGAKKEKQTSEKLIAMVAKNAASMKWTGNPIQQLANSPRRAALRKPSRKRPLKGQVAPPPVTAQRRGSGFWDSLKRKITAAPVQTDLAAPGIQQLNNPLYRKPGVSRRKGPAQRQTSSSRRGGKASQKKMRQEGPPRRVARSATVAGRTPAVAESSSKPAEPRIGDVSRHASPSEVRAITAMFRQTTGNVSVVFEAAIRHKRCIVHCAEWLDALDPGCLDLRLFTRLDAGDGDMRVREGLTSVILDAGRSAGVNFDEVTPLRLQILSEEPAVMWKLLKALARAHWLRYINPSVHPELTVLLDDGESLQQLWWSPEDTLLRWMNFHFLSAGENMITWFDDERTVRWKAQQVLLNAVEEAQSVGLKKKVRRIGHSRSEICKRAMQMNVGVEWLDTATEFTELLSVGFAMELFHSCSGLRVGGDVLPVVAGEGALDGSSSHERCYLTFLKSMSVEVGSGKLSDGTSLLEAMEKMHPGCVDWRRCSKHPKNKFEIIQNCNMAVNLSQAVFGFPMVGVGGVDLLQEKFIFSLLQQLMRHFAQRQLEKLLGGSTTDAELLVWVNQCLQSIGIFHLSVRAFTDCSPRVLLSVLFSTHPKSVDMALVHEDETVEQNLQANAKYCIAVARYIGASVFISWDHLVQRNNSKLLAVFVASLRCLQKSL